MFNIAANTVIPNYGAALTEGLQTGQNMQANALAMETARQKMQQEAALQPLEMNKKMKEVQALALSNEEAQAKQIGAWANQVKDPVSYARFRDMMKNVLGETEEGLLEDGLVPEYTPEVAAILSGSVGIAQGVPEREKAPEPFTLGAGDKRFSADGKLIASVPPRLTAEDKPKPPPVDFAEKLNERIGLDITDYKDELSPEDLTIIRNTAADYMRQGMDFEEAYNNALDMLVRDDTFGDYDYKLKKESAEEGLGDLGAVPKQPNGKTYFVAPKEGEEDIVMPNEVMQTKNRSKNEKQKSETYKELEELEKELQRARKLFSGEGA